MVRQKAIIYLTGKHSPVNHLVSESGRHTSAKNNVHNLLQNTSIVKTKIQSDLILC